MEHKVRIVWSQGNLQHLGEGFKAMMPINNSIDTALLSCFLYLRCIWGVLFCFSLKHIKSFQAGMGLAISVSATNSFGISFYESLKRGSILL